MPLLVEQNTARARWIGVVVMAAFIALGYVVSHPSPVPDLATLVSADEDSRSFNDVAAAEDTPRAPEPVPR